MNELQNNSNFSGPATARLEIPRLNFGQRLKQARLEKELSLAETARRTKISQTAIMDLESGDFNVITLAPHYCRAAFTDLLIAGEKIVPFTNHYLLIDHDFFYSH
jgi:DNA-binding XRE family transcriptional regulator